MSYVQRIPPQPPRSPAVSLLTAADQFPDTDRDYDRWRSGVAAQNLLCLSAANEPVSCPVGDDDERWDPEPPSQHEFVPVRTYLPYGCEGFIGRPGLWDEQAVAALNAKFAVHVARELWTGEMTGNPSLQSTAILLPTSGPLTPTAGAMMALASFEECTQGAQAFVHAPSAAEADLLSNGVVRRVGNKFVTPQDHVVVLGPGYPQSPGLWGPTHSYDGDGDVVTGAAAEAETGEAFLYVTGPVQVAGPVDTSGPPIVQQPRTNKHVSMPSVSTVYRFDSCCAFAVRIRVPDGSEAI